MSALGEFELIRRHFAVLTPAGRGVRLGIGDDCALLQIPQGQELAVTTDTLVEGRHFAAGTAAGDIGWKSLAVSLSDLAAMGAEPRWFTLALTLPQAEEDWLAAFAQGLQAMALEAGIALVGGDTTRGPLSITIAALGIVPAGRALRRAGARPGDRVCVTGTLGDAALALRLQQRRGAVAASLLQRLQRPTPRLAAGLALRGLASAAIDLSDGLAGDLRHILAASGVGATLQPQLLPQSPAFRAHSVPHERLELQLSGGDDYELCLCLPAGHLARAQQALEGALTPIGEITAEPGLRLVDGQGTIMPIDAQGYEHFQKP